MKRILTTLAVLLFFATSTFAVVKTNWADQFNNQPEVEALSADMAAMNIDQFLNLTPKKYKEMTGEKLGLKKTLQLKAAQKFLKKELKKDAEFDKGLYILLAILGLAWVAMGVMDDWSGSDWIVNLILVVLCWLPGLIHALTKMKKYY
jgi:uncharacterized membrane protein YqaE (UPF0057 family)/uncharacterized protein YxeA